MHEIARSDEYRHSGDHVLYSIECWFHFGLDLDIECWIVKIYFEIHNIKCMYVWISFLYLAKWIINAMYFFFCYPSIEQMRDNSIDTYNLIITSDSTILLIFTIIKKINDFINIKKIPQSSASLLLLIFFLTLNQYRN